MKKISLLIVLGLNLFSSAWLSAEQNVDVSQQSISAAELLSQQLQSMNTLTAHFHQKINDDSGEVLQEASGTLSVKRPRRFYWRTEQPYEHLVVTDGSLLWLYDIDLEQITRQAFSADLDKAPALLLSGEVDEISKQYQVRLETKNDATLKFQLSPNSSDSLFKQLTISFTAGELAAMSLKDSFDQLTVIKFSEVKRNTPIADELFKFIPPAGIDVITNEP